MCPVVFKQFFLCWTAVKVVIWAPTERGRYVPCCIETVLFVLDSSKSGDLGTKREREVGALLCSNSSFCVGQQ